MLPIWIFDWQITQDRNNDKKKLSDQVFSLWIIGAVPGLCRTSMSSPVLDFEIRYFRPETPASRPVTKQEGQDEK